MGMGRPVAEDAVREKVLCIRLTQSDSDALDASRGTSSRSDFARDAIREAIRLAEVSA